MANENVDYVTCGEHGPQPMTFVCTHIAHALLDGQACSFVIAPAGDDAYPLAWCEACDAMVVSLGGHWTEEASDRAEFKMFCGGCYSEARDLAQAAGQFRDLTAE